MRLKLNILVTAWGRLLLMLALALGLATTGQARPKPVPHRGRIYIPKMLPTIIPDAREGFQTVLRGRASWYGRFFQGMETASGERYNRFQWTCAHKTLPFGTRLRVTNIDNGVTVVVRVTDRGPFRHERILDLSEKAARPLGLVHAGASNVIAVVVPDETPLGLTDTPTDLAALQSADPRPHAAFTAYLLPLVSRASQLVAAVKPLLPAGPLADIAPAEGRYEIQAGTFASSQQAQTMLAKVHTIDPSLPGNVVEAVIDGKAVNQVVIGQLSSWLAAETVRRNLQVWGIAGQVRPQHLQPDALADTQEPAMGAAN